MSERRRPPQEIISTPEVKDGRKIIDISEKDILNIFGSQELSALLDTIVKNGKDAFTKQSIINFFVPKMTYKIGGKNTYQQRIIKKFWGLTQ